MGERKSLFGDPTIKSAPKEERKDSKGRALHVGSTVEVPDPRSDEDSWNHSFVGTIACFRDEYATVMDMEGDHFDIEPDRLESMDESD